MKDFEINSLKYNWREHCLFLFYTDCHVFITLVNDWESYIKRIRDAGLFLYSLLFSFVLFFTALFLFKQVLTLFSNIL